jgi:enoyl-CoA hydratase
MSDSRSGILFDRRGAAGLVTLDRPKALNAVTHAMVRALTETLTEWADDPSITRVVLTASGERAFSAGGDIRALYELGRAGRQQDALAFWRDEYRLNRLIKRYPKPYLALLDGIVMGGGVGIAIHGSHRIAGDRFAFAMPEVGIGFFPDVGATWFLPRLPGQLGTFCALTGERLGPDDAVASGIATHRVGSARFPELLNALCGPEPVGAVLAGVAEPAAAGALAARRSRIDSLFAADQVEEILGALDRAASIDDEGAGWAQATGATIRTKCPTSLKIALLQMRRGPRWTFDECLRAEYRIVSRIVYGKDFYEGVRAVIIDKDNAPQWHPGTLAEVSTDEVERHFAPLDGDDLVVP